MLRTSESVVEFSAALTKAQAGMGHAKKDRDNPHFKSQYATLASLLDACRELLTANGISVIQSPSTDGDKLTLTTRLSHKSGEWIEGEISIPIPGKGNVQALGSSITYLRRYALSSMVGIAPADESDDDGNAAVADSQEERRRDDRASRPRDERDRRDEGRREPAAAEPTRSSSPRETDETPSVRLQAKMDKVFAHATRDTPPSSEIVSTIFGDGFTEWWELPADKAQKMLDRVSACKSPTEALDMILQKYRSLVPF